MGQVATLKGKVLDEQNKPLEDAVVAVNDLNIGVTTLADGKFELTLPAGKFITIECRKQGYKSKTFTYRLNAAEVKNISISLTINTKQIVEIKKVATRNNEAGNVRIDVKPASIMPSTIGGIEGLLKIFLSGNNNELTSQYNVRGGNFDENLVYINDFEVYRPFLVRSGQQEGLSIINSDLVQNVNFSTGGFQAKYGDKMSSVLDVQYKRPRKSSSSVTLSLLQASIHTEGLSKNRKLSYLIGIRQKSNAYLLGAQQTQGVYNPSFTDAQVMLQYDINDHWSANVLGNYARNRFSYVPEQFKSSFGLINQAYQLNIRYDGNEIDQFDSRFVGLSFTNTVSDKLTLKYLASGFQTNEIETFDLRGEYNFGQLETDLGSQSFSQLKNVLGTGIIHTYARNYLTINVANLMHKGSYDANKHFIQWGINFNPVQINDELGEWERRDSSGFSQPASTTELLMSKNYRSSQAFNYGILSAFVQDNIAFDSLRLSITYGARLNYSTLNKEWLVSPRVQASWKPTQWRKNAVMRGAVGLYQQPPFYRELRNMQGVVSPDVRAQKSMHFLLGSDFNFIAWKRPFRFTVESYYKYLWDLVPYEYDNIRIRYFGKNASKGYARGIEGRLYGDLVKDAESWISIGWMATGEDIKDDIQFFRNNNGTIIDSTYPGYIPRPTDSRFTLGMFFQDYFPTNKNIKVHMNAMYGTGLPFGLPDGNKYNDVYRLPAYRRVDIGFSALLVDPDKKNRPGYSLFHQFESIWGSVEVFNLLDIRNTIGYIWIQDQTTGNSFAAPNQLTSRLLNLKIIAKL
jgi:hypothetical protein